MSTANAIKTRTVKVPRIQYRDFEVEVEARADQSEGQLRFYPVSFSSEVPVRRFSWDTWEEYDEVLSHAPGDVDLSRAKNGLPLIKSHQRLLHFGSVNDIALDEKRGRLRGMASFSSIPLGQEQETMLREGHIKTVSVGYQVLSMEMVAKDKTTGLATYRCRWMPYEVSTEPIPADYKVGFGRARTAPEVDLVEFTIEEPATEGERTMSVDAGTPQPTAAYAPAPGTETSAGPATAAPAPKATETRDRGAEAAEIMDMAQAHRMTDRAAGWIRQGLSPDQVSREILKAVRTQGPGQPSAEALAAMPARDRKRYSIHRAIRMQAELMDGKRARYDGLEAEIHDELVKHRTGADHGGVLVPWRLSDDDQQRVLGTTQQTGGATLVGQQVMPDMIDLLRNRALVLVAGARLYPGLQGVVYFNKKTGAPTVTWMEENPPSDAPQSEPSYGYVSLSPKTLIGQVQIPRQLLVMSSIDVEADIRSDLATGHGLALDLGALHGKGTDKQPVGIYGAGDVQSHPVGGVPDLEDITTMPALVADKNADLGALSWMTTPLMAGVLKRTPLVSGYPVFLWVGTYREGELGGYPARTTNQISKTLGAGSNEHGLVFGNWNDLLVGMWGNDLEIVVDVVTKAARGQILITSYSMADTAVRRGESFVKGTGALLS
jgi:HK97 family phage major capsid protein